MSKLLECTNLTKKYGGLTALNRVSFTLDSGKMIGLLGPNGSGKTTTAAKLAKQYRDAGKKVMLAARDLNIREVAVAGGVSANSGLQRALLEAGEKYNWTVHIPSLSFSTDNAAMIAVAGYFKYRNGEFSDYSVVPYTRGAMRPNDVR